MSSRWLKVLVVALFAFFAFLYFFKLRDYQKEVDLLQFQKKINDLRITNFLIHDEVKSVIGNRYVSYDPLIEKMKRFQSLLYNLKNSQLQRKTDIQNYLKEVQKLFGKKRDILEKIIQDSALLKASYLYLPTLEEAIVLSGEDRLLIRMTHKILEFLSYRIYVPDTLEDRDFLKRTEILKSYKCPNKKLKKNLNDFVMHALMVFRSLKDLQKRLDTLFHIDEKMNMILENIEKRVQSHILAAKRWHIYFEGFLFLVMMLFIGLIFYFVQKNEKAQKKILQMVQYDMLTKLPNRYRLFQDIAIVRKKRERFYLVRFDLDNFASINENLGYHAGDEILKWFANILEQICPQRTYRVTSDEFVIVCIDIDKEELDTLLKRLQKEVKAKSPYFFTFSAAVLEVTPACQDEKEMALLLQAALYSAKKRGGDTIVWYDPEDPYIKEYFNISSKALEIRKILEEAIEKKQFVLHYQPIYNINSAKVEKYEILVRIKERNDLLLPQNFIPYAERFNKIGAITRFIVDEAFKEVASRNNIAVTINLSALDIKETHILNYILKQKKNYDIDPSLVTFEITESGVVEDFDEALFFIEILKREGFSIAIDDFGTGQSSLEYLKKIPADLIKIDGAFVKDIDKNPKDAAFLKEVAAIIKILGKKSVAEYVENEKILEILKEIGIDYAQGYYIGKPKPLD